MEKRRPAGDVKKYFLRGTKSQKIYPIFDLNSYWILVCVLEDVRENLNVWCVITNVRYKRTAGAFSF